jgi:hypothetical protein
MFYTKCEVCSLDSFYHFSVLYNAEHKDIHKEFVIEGLSKSEYLLFLLKTNKNSDICNYLDETQTIIKYHYPDLWKLVILL